VNVLTPFDFANCRTEGILVPARSSRRLTMSAMAATIWSTRLPRRWRSMAMIGQSDLPVSLAAASPVFAAPAAVLSIATAIKKGVHKCTPFSSCPEPSC
jgi:hypothetical protein